MKYIMTLILLGCATAGCCQSTKSPLKMEHGKSPLKIEHGKSPFKMEHSNTGNQPALTCKLTTPELQRRKATVISSLKKQVIEKKELPDGYNYKFLGTDDVIEELATFIKTERMCCHFFEFTLKVAGDASASWLSITGPEGAKDFITTELDL